MNEAVVQPHGQFLVGVWFFSKCGRVNQGPGPPEMPAPVSTFNPPEGPTRFLTVEMSENTDAEYSIRPDIRIVAWYCLLVYVITPPPCIFLAPPMADNGERWLAPRF